MTGNPLRDELLLKRVILKSVTAGAGASRRNETRAEWPVFVLLLAEWTGLEPATPGVTGRYSNQLNYHSMTPDMAG